MFVKLISSDQDLYKQCRETLEEIPGHNCSLSAGDSIGGDLTADLYLWDFSPNLLVPTPIHGSPARHLFLVHKKDLSEFRRRTGPAEATILLKPVTRATLSAFLGLAVASQNERISASHSLRADRDEILQCLIETNLKLQEYDQDRTNFLARAVHDFRAPLTAISGYCGLLLSEPFGSLDENQRDVLLRMQHSAKRLSRMASAMFQLSVGRHVKKLPDLRPGDLAPCLEHALQEIAPFAEEKRIAITADLAPCGSRLYFEAAQVEQVLINILDNACKFAPKDGAIEINGYTYFSERLRSGSAASAASAALERRNSPAGDPNAYRIDIRDSGPRIPEEHLPSIFEEYTSYGGGRDRSGGGLGLAVCKMIINQHEGHVWAENSSEGPMFSFVLPLSGIETAQASERQHITA
jgi:signal transduction histidine kinase